MVSPVLLANNQDALSRTQVQVKVWLSKGSVWTKVLNKPVKIIDIALKTNIYLNKFDFTRPNRIFSNLNKRISCRKLSYASVVPPVLLANNQDALSHTQVQVKVWLLRRVWAKLLTETPLSKEAPPRPARPKRFPIPVVLSSALDCKFVFSFYFTFAILQCVRTQSEIVQWPCRPIHISHWFFSGHSYIATKFWKKKENKILLSFTRGLNLSFSISFHIFS